MGKPRAVLSVCVENHIRGLENRLRFLEDEIIEGMRLAQEHKANGETPAHAMAELLFHKMWATPTDRGVDFESRYFWELQESIVDNLERAATMVGAKIIWS